MPHTSLLASAQAFARRAGSAAALAVVPLAVVELAPKASGQITFNVPTNLSSGGGYGGNISISNFTAAQSSGGGVSQGADFSLSNITAASGNSYLYFDAYGSGSLGTGPMLPYSYDFTLTASPSTDLTWTLYAAVDGGNAYSDNIEIGQGSGTGTFSGSGTLTLDTANFGDTPSYSFNLTVDYTTGVTDGTQSFAITMDQPGQGVTISGTPVPEPSVYALLAGAGALGLVVLRRRPQATGA